MERWLTKDEERQLWRESCRVEPGKFIWQKHMRKNGKKERNRQKCYSNLQSRGTSIIAYINSNDHMCYPHGPCHVTLHHRWCVHGSSELPGRTDGYHQYPAGPALATWLYLWPDARPSSQTTVDPRAPDESKPKLLVNRSKSSGTTQTSAEHLTKLSGTG